MRATTIAAVRGTWGMLERDPVRVSTLFYERLFELDPSLRPLFRSDLSQQAHKLSEMISIAVQHLDQSAVMVPALQALGRRHADYGVLEAHYDTVGRALLDTLERTLGPSYTPPVREAWTELFGVLRHRMLEGAATNGPRGSAG